MNKVYKNRWSYLLLKPIDKFITINGFIFFAVFIASIISFPFQNNLYSENYRGTPEYINRKGAWIFIHRCYELLNYIMVFKINWGAIPVIMAIIGGAYWATRKDYDSLSKYSKIELEKSDALNFFTKWATYITSCYLYIYSIYMITNWRYVYRESNSSDTVSASAIKYIEQGWYMPPEDISLFITILIISYTLFIFARLGWDNPYITKEKIRLAEIKLDKYKRNLGRYKTNNDYIITFVINYTLRPIIIFTFTWQILLYIRLVIQVLRGTSSIENIFDFRSFQSGIYLVSFLLFIMTCLMFLLRFFYCYIMGFILIRESTPLIRDIFNILSIAFESVLILLLNKIMLEILNIKDSLFNGWAVLSTTLYILIIIHTALHPFPFKIFRWSIKNISSGINPEKFKYALLGEKVENLTNFCEDAKTKYKEQKTSDGTESLQSKLKISRSVHSYRIKGK
ncbi:MAG: hypothetical protein Q4P78_05450 [Rothia sp. (in: high G+C Gram-positive bacteria)]|uniref:hypothetical protein n=1 Tax=Rothia sp. (in: high G+C Gram-positive bacteria) TaxID=1885016 RepID=UPI0026E09F7D|nr:hypothetical protein [Rothia sp. (in: high G+C Gram-positive bacteria)]MDO5750632.1 hypothetical protein [Rothia sp. (in: high G+C Gram-positive bacteria)]